MARSTRSYEERMLQLEKKEQDKLLQAKQKRELKKRQKDVETKKRTHRLYKSRCSGVVLELAD